MIDMATKYVIKSEFPTPDEIAAAFRIPPARVAELRRRMAALSEAERKQQQRRKQASKKK